MRAVVVYESMFGNTHEVAEQIATGLRPRFDVAVLPVGDAIGQILTDLDLLVVGGPTHAHGMSRHSTRAAAVSQAGDDPDLDAEPGADGPGLREWFHGLPPDHGTPAAAFDTRFDAAPLLTGRAAKVIAKQLDHHGFDVVAEPVSFLIDKQNHLMAGQAELARAWATSLAGMLAPTY